MTFLAGYAPAQMPASPEVVVAAARLRDRILAAGAGWAPLGGDHVGVLVAPEAAEAGPCSLWLAGRVDTLPEVAARLAAEGRSPAGPGAAALLAAGWLAWGEALLPLLDGGFVLAVRDAAARSLTLVRDRFGQWPVLYAEAGGDLAFATGFDLLQAWPAPLGGLDHDALAHALAFGHAPLDRGLLRNLRQLPPGHLLRRDAAGRIALHRWARPQPAHAAPEVAEQMLWEALAYCDEGPAVAPAPVTPEHLAGFTRALGEPAVQPQGVLLAAALEAGGSGPVALAEGLGEMLCLHPRYRRIAGAVRAQLADGLLPSGWEPGYHGTAPFVRDLYHGVAGALSEAERLEWSGPAMAHTLTMAMPDGMGTALEAAQPETAAELAAAHDRSFRLPGLVLRQVAAAASLTGRPASLPLLRGHLLEAAAALPPAARGDCARRLLQGQPAAAGFAAWEFDGDHDALFDAELREFALDTLLSRASRDRGIFARARLDLAARDMAEVRPGAARALWTMLSVELWCRLALDSQPLAAEGPLPMPRLPAALRETLQ